MDMVSCWNHIEKAICIPMMFLSISCMVANASVGNHTMAFIMAACFIWWIFVTYRHYIKPRLDK